MAKALKSVQLFSLFCILILLANWKMMPAVEAKVCEKASLTWSGGCKHTAHCDRQCKNWEDARHGACHKRNGHWKCFRYFNCE